MSEHHGFIKLYRCLKDNDVFLESKNEGLLRLFLWVLIVANYKETVVNKNGETVTLQAGQFICGRREGAKRTDLTPSKFWRLLQSLESRGMITIESKKMFSIITVTNWKKYQKPEKSEPVFEPVTSQLVNHSENVETIDNKGDSGCDAQKVNRYVSKKKFQKWTQEKKYLKNNIYEPNLFSENDKDKKVSKAVNKHPMVIWINENTEIVKKIPKQLSYKECETILEQYPKDVVKETILDMDNYKGTKNYRSLYRTLRNWLKRTEQFQKSKSGGNNHPQQSESNIKYLN